MLDTKVAVGTEFQKDIIQIMSFCKQLGHLFPQSASVISAGGPKERLESLREIKSQCEQLLQDSLHTSYTCEAAFVYGSLVDRSIACFDRSLESWILWCINSREEYKSEGEKMMKASFDTFQVLDSLAKVAITGHKA